jgi:CBS-domain-containing membrane protein
VLPHFKSFQASFGSLRPPGGATALIAVIGGDNIHQLGYSYALFPVAS